MIKHYEDFEVVITKQGDQLCADLVAAPGGRNLTRPVPITLPKDKVAWAEARQGRKSEADLAELGHQLFEAIITGELEDNWHACLGEVRQRSETGLRLRFSYQADALPEVPLELLCSRTDPTREFLALHARTPVVRSPRDGGSVLERPIELPLRMLVVIATPALQPRIDPILECGSLKQALADLLQADMLEIDYLGVPGCPRADYSALHHALVQANRPYDIVHFVGHGALPDADSDEGEGILLLVDSQTGRRQDVYASDLAGILAPNGVRIAILQACDSARDGTHNAFQGVAQRFISVGLPAAVAMQCPVDRDVATWFFGQFYHFWLSESGLAIERALTEARQAVHHRFRDRPSAWWAPVLFIHAHGPRLLKVCVDEQPFRASLNLDLSDALLELGQVQEAVDRLVARARLLEETGDEEGALAACERVLQVSPNQPRAQEIRRAIWIRRGDAALERGELDVALAAYRHAGAGQKIRQVESRKQKREVEARTREAAAYEKAKQWARAAEIYQQLLAEGAGDKELKDEWKRALRRAKSKSSKAEQRGWTPGYVLDDRYRIVKQLATTARSEIYLAEETQPPIKTLVVKRLRPDKLQDEDALQRFEREIDVLEQIRHQSVLFLRDFKTVGEYRYLVAEFADRGTLREYLAARPEHMLSPIEALEIAVSVCRGLEVVHSQGIVHCDVKPGNILLFSQRDGSILAKLADFSIAHVPEESGDEALTKTGFGLGTDLYTSPEQRRDQVADARSDLYSWALVFFEMLTGESPTDSLLDPITYASTSDEFSVSFLVERGVPPRIAKVLRRNLFRDRDLRSQSAAEVREALEKIESGFLVDVQRHLNCGEDYTRRQEWQAANAEFEQGLTLCGWCGEPDELHGPVPFRELARRLRIGHLFTQGMMHLDEQRWPAAIEALGPVRALVPDYLGLDVATELRRAQAEQQREQDYQVLLEYRKQGNWEEIIRRAAYLTTAYVGSPGSESVGGIRKLALYARGRELVEEGRLEDAYHRFYRLYDRDHGYDDVAEQCAKVAYSIGVREDIPHSWEHQVKWLKRALEIDPNHRQGRTRQRLDMARHRWATELLEVDSDRRAAVVQLERISSDYDQWTEVREILVKTCNELGEQEYKKEHWRDAIEWWCKVLEIIQASPDDIAQNVSQDLKRTIQRQIRTAKRKAWVKDNETIIVVVCTIVPVLIALWSPIKGCVVSMIEATPSPTVEIVTPSPVPPLPSTSPSPVRASSTPTPTFTPTVMPSQTPTPTHTSTITPSLAPSPVPPTPSPPELFAPAHGHTYQNPVVFEWRGSLSAGQAYQVTARHSKANHTVQSGLLTDPRWSVHLPAERYGEWRWTVSVVQGGRTVATSVEWRFWFDPKPQPTREGGGNGGNGEPTPAQPPTPANP